MDVGERASVKHRVEAIHYQSPDTRGWGHTIIAIAHAVAAILFSNYLLALVVIVAAVTLALHGAKHPPMHRFRLDERGLYIGEAFHPYARMTSFSVLEDIKGEFPPVLSIKTESWLSPHLVIPLAGVDADMIYTYFLQHVDESEHDHSFIDLVAAWLGF